MAARLGSPTPAPASSCGAGVRASADTSGADAWPCRGKPAGAPADGPAAGACVYGPHCFRGSGVTLRR